MNSASLTLGGSVSIDDKYVPVRGGSEPVGVRPVPVNDIVRTCTEGVWIWVSHDLLHNLFVVHALKTRAAHEGF